MIHKHVEPRLDLDAMEPMFLNSRCLIEEVEAVD